MYINELCNLQEQAYNNKIGIWKEKTEIGYCSTHKNIKKTSDNNMYSIIVNNFTRFLSLLMALIFLVVVLVFNKRRRSYGKYKKNKRSRT